VAPRGPIGFACNWDPRPRPTWSYTPWHLRAALASQVEVVDVGVRIPRPARAGLKVLSARRVDGRWVSPWKHTRAVDRWCQRVIGANATRLGCRAVLEMQDLAAPPVPFFLYQDLTFDILLRVLDERRDVPHFPGLGRDDLLRRRDRQLAVYERAEGLLVMSRWAASTLVEWSGVPADKVHTVYPGRTVRSTRPLPDRRAPRTGRLLLVGRDLHTKGADVVAAALAHLRHGGHPGARLTIAGPAAWTLPGAVPEAVTLLGPVAPEAVPELFDGHDLLVMPSRLEGFGIVFVEALARGLPCIGRRAFAMPELINPGRNGDLVDGDDPEALAAAIERVLADDDLYRSCAADAEAVALRFTWERAASEVLAAMDGY